MVDSYEYFWGLVLVVILGLGWGSFATMATYRLPRGMPWIGDRPRCFVCKHELNIIDYFSIVSFFLWKGKCRYCGHKFEDNFPYFLVEFLITFTFVLCYIEYGFGDIFVLISGFLITAVILAVIDAQNKFIPPKVLISLMIIGSIYRTFVDGSFYGILYGSLFGGILGLIVRYIFFSLKGEKEIAADFLKWQHHDRFTGPGFDYVKLMAICGIWLGYSHFTLFFIICGSVILLWYMVHQKSLRIGTIIITILTYCMLYPGTLSKLILLL